MYKIVNTKKDGLEFVEIIDSNDQCKAKISLNEGGRLQTLNFEDRKIIGDPSNSTYENNFAASILFPFANRIKNGKYTFEGKTYEFDCNENGGGNAIHGLVYNKKFELVDKEIGTDFVSLTLLYQEKNKSKGFPFYYTILLTYTFSENAIALTVKIKNLDKDPFPYTLGWHPYFLSKDLYTSSLNFECDKKIQFDKNLITLGIADCNLNMPYQIKNTQLDDCFIMKSNTVVFVTPEYCAKINTDTTENYFQFYTPNDTHAIAIEPMLGVSDSFNNKIGLQVLQPNQEHEINWKVSFSNVND